MIFMTDDMKDRPTYPRYLTVSCWNGYL